VKASPNAISVLHYFEQCRLKAYPDPGTGGAPWTVGWGDTGPDVVPGMCLSQDEADERFAERLNREFEPGVRNLLARPASQAQFDAMVCLAYNIGLGNFGSSTLLRRFNANNITGADEQFPVWNRAGGRVMLGLRRRRAAEQALFRGKSGPEAIAIGSAIT
jgi:lysozyme